MMASVHAGANINGHAGLANMAERLHNAAPQLADALGDRVLQLEPRHARPVAVRTGAVVLATDISANRRIFPCPAITLCGLTVEGSRGRLLGAVDGQPVPGLYAVGRTSVGIASNHYVSGLSLGDCIWSRRTAGRHITYQLADTRQADTNQETRYELSY